MAAAISIHSFSNKNFSFGNVRLGFLRRRLVFIFYENGGNLILRDER